MSGNLVAFQKGLSEPQFYVQYGAEQQCLESLESLRLAREGLACPECGHNKAHRLARRPRIQQGGNAVITYQRQRHQRVEIVGRGERPR